jgi:pyruvate/2-oxoglutarate dehydrogenase complex dihydrolipoamide acyltransferase (E2) component
VEGRIEIRPIATVTLTADHRLINGRIAAEYVTKLKEIIEAGEIV